VCTVILNWDMPICKSGSNRNYFQLIHFQDYPSFCSFHNGGNSWIDYNSKQLLSF
jgi:hypothetical protein